MLRERIYRAWAPAESPWSAWVKPVLFAHLQDEPSASSEVAVSIESWARPADGSSAIVVDLPSASGVSVGLSLASFGYRPIPLYNACPWPDGAAFDAGSINVRPIMAALVALADRLSSSKLAPEAPPAFLLDADRRGLDRPSPEPGSFDNRSVSLPTDFPSGSLLLSRGIRRALLVQATGRVPQVDLAHTLLRWQKAGIEISAVALSEPGLVVPIRVASPPWFRRAWYAFVATLGLRRSPFGGYGGALPTPSAG